MRQGVRGLLGALRLPLRLHCPRVLAVRWLPREWRVRWVLRLPYPHWIPVAPSPPGTTILRVLGSVRVRWLRRLQGLPGLQGLRWPLYLQAILWDPRLRAERDLWLRQVRGVRGVLEPNIEVEEPYTPLTFEENRTQTSLYIEIRDCIGITFRREHGHGNFPRPCVGVGVKSYNRCRAAPARGIFK
jgi:hypothetical protein